jgi:hypothetical protein
MDVLFIKRVPYYSLPSHVTDAFGDNIKQGHTMALPFLLPTIFDAKIAFSAHFKNSYEFFEGIVFASNGFESCIIFDYGSI